MDNKYLWIGGGIVLLILIVVGYNSYKIARIQNPATAKAKKTANKTAQNTTLAEVESEIVEA